MYGRFLIAYYVNRPRDPSRSSMKNAGKENMQTDEQIGFAIKLSEKELMKASVVLELDKRQVLRSKGGLGKDFDKLFNHYNLHYSEHIDKFMGKESEVNVEK